MTLPVAVTNMEVRPGVFMLVDTADVPMLSGFTLQVVCGGLYVRADRGAFTIYVHRLISGAAVGEEVDHWNANGLDNRSANLRRTDRKGNAANTGKQRRKGGTTSRHKGVSWSNARHSWAAVIRVNGKSRYLGRYALEDDAAAAYNAAALEAWGEMARLNIIGGAPA